jgi:short-subunit dehydrogenase
MNNKPTLLIIGAKSDIAISVANFFASKGYDLQLAARNIDELGEYKEILESKYQISVNLYELDILNYESFPKFISLLNKLPDIALCAVGILNDQLECEQKPMLSSIVFETNFIGPSLFFAEIANCFKKRKSGSIIGISSVAGEKGRASNYIYGSSKAGFSNFLSGLRNRLYKHNVNVLTVLPGPVKTKMTRHLNTSKFISSSPDKVAKIIYKNRQKSKIVYTPPWKILMFLIKLLPEKVFLRIKL